ncbi:MAG: BrnA antitoxin family protein [Candidatus Accumulibacter sp.]|jgi:uncharacterized protein (DUF4415 family)|nr:BrnA antitoxin family protein [Accumulibacter sp.]
MKSNAITEVSSADLPEAPELTDADLAHARLRVGMKDVSREEFSAAVREKLGKQRVSIMLDAAVVAFFKAKAGERGYQTLINQTLCETMRDEKLESTLRRILREERRAA